MIDRFIYWEDCDACKGKGTVRVVTGEPGIAETRQCVDCHDYLIVLPSKDVAA